MAPIAPATPDPQFRRAASVRGRLVMLVAAIAVPLILLAALAVWFSYNADRSRQEESLVRRARAAANMVDSQFEDAISVLRVLAASQALAKRDLDAFEIEMRHTSAAFDGALINLTAPDGSVVLSTNWPRGEHLTDVKATPFAQAAIRSDQSAVSDLFIGKTTGLPRVGVAFPVQAPTSGDPHSVAQPLWLLTLYLPVGQLSKALDRMNLPPTWLATIADRQLKVVARSRHPTSSIGHQPPEDLATAIAAKQMGVLSSNHRDPEGVESLSAFAHAPQSGYVVALGVPQAEISGPMRATLVRIGLIAGVLAVLGLAGALLLSRRIVGALGTVAAAPPGTAPPTGLREIDELARAIATTEAARRESDDSFRLLAETMPGWVFGTDAAGNNTYVNSTFREQTGLVEPTLNHLGWLRVVHPDDRARAHAGWLAAIAAGNDYQAEYRCKVRDGSNRWFLVRARPLRDDSGVIVHWFGVAVDIHDRREAEFALQRNEAALRALNQNLESRVRAEIAARETAQLRAAQAERLQALGQLAGGVAHDFNNILQGVQGAAALIDRRASDPVQVGKLARMIGEATTRGGAITRRLLAFSRRDNLQPEPVHPLTLLQGMRELLLHTVGDGIEVAVTAADDLPALFADKGSLETVLINLATNGSDAMAGNGRLVLAASEEILPDRPGDQPGMLPPSLPVNLKPGAYIRISVSDTGTGMDSATLARASEPFFTTKPVGKGTGLGLAMARGFAEQSGGDLLIDSKLGHGTVVHLWLPQSNVVTPTREVPAALPAHPSRHPRLLLVDDDAVVRQTLTQEMEDAGYQVRAVSSAAEALALLDAGERVDLVVSDLSMPGMSGAAMINEALQRRPELKVILITGFANEVPVDTNVTLLHKPISGPTLAHHVAGLLAGETV